MKKNLLQFVLDRDRVYLYPWYFADEILTDKKNRKFFGETVLETAREFKAGHIYSYDDLLSYARIGEFLLKKIITDRNFYKQVEKNIYKFSNELLKFCKDIDKLELSKISSGELFRIYVSYEKKLKELRKWGWIPVLVDGYDISHLTNYIMEEMRKSFKGFSAEEISRYYSILSSSEKLSEVRKEEKERLKLLLNIGSGRKAVVKIIKDNDIAFAKEKLRQNYPAVWKKILLHTKKYEWLPYAYIGPKMSPENALGLMKGNLSEKKNLKNALKEMEKHYRELPQKRKAVIKKIKLASNLAYLLRVSRFFMYLKDYRKGVYQKSYVCMDRVIDEIARRLGLSAEAAKYITAEELGQLLKSERKNNKNLLKQIRRRHQYCVAIASGGATLVLTGGKAKEIMRKIKKYSVKESRIAVADEIKGMVAFSGKAEGIVKIVAIADDIEKVKEGDILVSPATNPDLIAAMKKAAAFVTDMGGITSHAAIVSRELKKPCIVGTKIATKVLRDGQLVEVDADKGIVRIIK